MIAAAVAVGTAASAAEPVRPSAAPAFLAPAPVAQGYVGARFGLLWGAGGTQLIDEKTAAANVALPWGGFELEGRGTGLFQSGSSTATSLGLGHLYLRNSARALGVFGGMESFAGIGLLVGGIEAQAYLGRAVVYGQLATAPAISGTNTWWTRTGVQVFQTENMMLQGDVRYLSGAVNSWLLAGTAEVRAGSTPWAGYVTLKYQTGVGSGGGDATTVLGGLRIHVGNSSLYQAYTTGAIWNVLPGQF
jgi:hypothetical protein